MPDTGKHNPEARANPFVTWNGELTDVGKKLLGQLGAGKVPKYVLDRGMHDLEILDKQLKNISPVREHYSNRGLATEKAVLIDLLDHSFDKDSRPIFRDQLQQFETRAWANAIPKEAVAETYKEIGRILPARGNEPLTPELRKQVAREVIRNCSDPTVISQGNHNTCNVTAVEVRTYSLHPAQAARLVADIATTGNYKTKGGIAVALDAPSMVPDKEALKSRPQEGKREYATQLFNLAAANIWYSAVKPGMHYEQRLHTAHSKEIIEERITDYSSGTAKSVLDPLTKKPIDSPYFAADQIAFISDAIVGHHEPFAVLAMGPHSLYLPGEKRQHVHAANIIDEPHLPVILETLKKKHLLPAIAHVDTTVEPLNTDTGCGAYGDGGGHVINIFDYKSGHQPRVSMDNEWRKEDDHLDASVDLHDGYLCMAGSEIALNDASINAEAAREKGKQSAYDELTAVRLQGERSGNYAKEAADTVTRCTGNERKLIGADREKWFDTLRTIVNTVAPTEKVCLLKRIDTDKVCSSEEFGRLVAGAAHSIAFQKKQAMEEQDSVRKMTCIHATTALAEYLITLPLDARKHYFNALQND